MCLLSRAGVLAAYPGIVVMRVVPPRRAALDQDGECDYWANAGLHCSGLSLQGAALAGDLEV